jgi:hypothetical protein
MRTSVIAPILLAVGTVLLPVVVRELYPGHRVLHWFEFITDGWMPPVVANTGQNVLARMWEDGIKNSVGYDKELIRSVAVYLRSLSRPSVIEIASGSGMASALWLSRLREELGLENTTLLLTDLQPNPGAWSRIIEKFGSQIQYVNNTVDACDLEGSLRLSAVKLESDLPQRSLRMINMALHHFTPDLVGQILQDVVRSRSAIVIGDVAPTAGGVLYLGLSSMKYAFSGALDTLRYSSTAELYQGSSWWVPLIVPFLPAMGIHDATISVLRSYSPGQLKDILNSVHGAEDYTAEVFCTGHYSDLLGWPQPRRLIGLSEYLGLRDSVLQYVLIKPKDHVRMNT